MKNLIIIIIFTIIFGGCTINFGPTQPEREIKTEVTETKKEVTETKKETHKPWPHVKKEYWYAKYFLSMAMNPNVQRMLTPEQVFDVVKCTVDGFEKDYTFEQFLKKIGGNMNLTPQLSKYVYELSLRCSQEIKRKVKKEQGERSLKL